MKKKHVLTLQHWSNLNKAKRKEALNNDDHFISFLVECILNILAGVVPINLNQLKKFERELKQLTDPKINTERKIKLLASEKGNSLLKLISVPCADLLLA